MKKLIQFLRQSARGQSLAETALVMPILVLLIAGVIEASNLVLVQNRISTAARSGARFGANGGEDPGILNVTLNTVTQTLSLDPNIWDIWVVRAEVDDNRQIPADQFTFTHVYGSQMTTLYTETNTVTFTNDLRLQIEAQLRLNENNDPNADSSGLKVVGTYVLYEIDSILGLDVLPTLLNYRTIQGFSIMRRAAVATSIDQTEGCRGVFPIVLEQGVRTISQAEFDAIRPQFTYPTGINVPRWEDFPRQPPPGTTAPLLQGLEGYVFKFNAGNFTSRNFDWLKWNTNITALNGGGNLLATSLTWPGNSSDHQNRGDSPNPPPGSWPYPFTFRGFAEAGDPEDNQLHGGDFIMRDGVSGGFGGLNVEQTLRSHIDSQRVLRMVLWDANGDSAEPRYRASGFAVFRIRGYSTSGGWLLMELYRLDLSCGQTINN